MMIGITDTIRLIEEMLGPDGWRSMGGLFGRNKNNPNIYAKNGRIVVVQGPISVSAETLLRGGGRRQVQDEFEDYLHRLQKELQDHINAVRPQGITLAMQGGGALQLPQWFADWCEQMGIELIIVEPIEKIRTSVESLEELIFYLRDLYQKIESSSKVIKW